MNRPYVHWETVEVRWGDMDALGHVNNARYFTYCETARMSLFEALELSRFRTEPRLGVGLVHASLDFKQQVRFPANIEVGQRVARIGGSSFTLEYGLYREGTALLVASGSAVVVWMDFEAGEALALPETLRSTIEAYTA